MIFRLFETLQDVPTYLATPTMLEIYSSVVATRTEGNDDENQNRLLVERRDDEVRVVAIGRKSLARGKRRPTIAAVTCSHEFRRTTNEH